MTKTILITGASRGLGFATAEKLAQAGHEVILCSRDLVRGKQTLDQLQHKLPHARLQLRRIDMASFNSIRTFVEGVLRDELCVDVLLHNAGVLSPSLKRKTTVDGLEETLAVNALGPFLLTQLLFPALLRSESARILSVSSRLHIPGSRGRPPRFNFDDPMLTHDYDPDVAYKNSKLALMWFTYELQRRLTALRMVANAVCPGFVPATAAVDATGLQKFMLRYVLPRMPFANTVQKSSSDIAWAAVDRSLEGVGGKFFAERIAIPSSEESYDLSKARRFWELACTLVGTDDWPQNETLSLKD